MWHRIIYLTINDTSWLSHVYIDSPATIGVHNIHCQSIIQIYCPTQLDLKSFDSGVFDYILQIIATFATALFVVHYSVGAFCLMYFSIYHKGNMFFLYPFLIWSPKLKMVLLMRNMRTLWEGFQLLSIELQLRRFFSHELHFGNTNAKFHSKHVFINVTIVVSIFGEKKNRHTQNFFGSIQETFPYHLM